MTSKNNNLYDIKLSDTGIFIKSNNEKSLLNRLEEIDIDNVGSFLKVVISGDEFRKLNTNHRLSLYKEAREIYGIYQLIKYKYLNEDSLHLLDSNYMSIDEFIYTEPSLPGDNNIEIKKHSIENYQKRFIKYHEIYERLNYLGFSESGCKKILEIYLKKYTKNINNQLIGIKISIKDLLLDIDYDDFLMKDNISDENQETLNRINLLKQYIIESHYKITGQVIDSNQILKKRMYLKRELKEKIDAYLGYKTIISDKLQNEINIIQEQIFNLEVEEIKR